MHLHDHFQFCPQLVSMLQTGRITGRSGTVREISSLTTLNSLVVLKNLFAEFKPKRTLEVGLAFGGSALIFTASHREMGAEPSQQHTAIDPFQSTDWDDAGIVAVESSSLRGYLDFRCAMSSAALPQLIAEEATFDLIYIDGSHFFEDVFVDFYYATRLLSDGGILLFDDSSDPHVQKVLRFIRTNCPFTYKPFDVSPYRADKGATARYRIAKLLGKNQLTAFQKIGSISRVPNPAFASF